MYEFLQSLIQGLLDGIRALFVWLYSVLQSFFDGLKYVLSIIFKPVILFFTGIFYLLEKCFYIVILVVQIIFGIFKLVASVIVGIFNTFAQLLQFSGSTNYYYMPSAYEQGWYAVFNFLNSTGFNTIAMILAAFLWILTAYAVIRIAGGGKVNVPANCGQYF